MIRTTLRQLEIFVAIARTGTVTEAADAVGLTQSAASMALAELERQIDMTLFDRRAKRLVLNESGRILYPKAMELIDRAREIDNLFAVEMDAADLRLGASSTVGNYLLPQLMGSFIGKYPGSKFSLEVGNTHAVIAATKRYDIDVGFIEGPCHDKDVNVLLWRRDELAICAAADDPLAGGGPISPADLVNAKWILREPGSGTREIADMLLTSQLGTIRLEMELGGTEAIKRAVESGLGISCLPRVAVAETLRHGNMVCLPTPFLNLTRHLYVVLHKDKYRTAGLERFLSHCLALAEAGASVS